MIKVVMHGCNGAMGKVITELMEEDEMATIIAGIDLSARSVASYPVYASLNDCEEKPDVIIDFASPKAIDGLLEYCAREHVPLVLCTTGLSSEQIERVGEASKQVAILHSANMSLGVNLLLKLVKEAANVLANSGFDIEIVEKHHNQKVDAPSGTALALADSINEGLEHSYGYQYDRTQIREKRNKDEIGIHAVRGGTIVGEHDVIFAGIDEVITFQHTAYSKAIFAKGAIQAAKFLATKQPGLYTMSDMID